MNKLATILLSAALLTACGDDATDPSDITPMPDGSMLDAGMPDAEPEPDAAVCESPMATTPGGACETSADCDSEPDAGDGFCLDENQPVAWPAVGYCVRFECDLENPCPEGSVCTEFFENDVSAGTICMQACCDGDSCSPGSTCTNEYAGSIELSENVCIPIDEEAVDGEECESIGDCNANSFCRNLRFEFPGGMCATLDCTLGNDATCAPGGDGHCIVGPNGNLCVDVCTQDSDCRDSEGYKCFDGGDDGLYCRHPKVSDPCAVDSDCGEAPWECEEGFPGGGHCTIKNCTVGTASGCPVGDLCVDPDEGTADDQYCAKDCDPLEPTDCRTGYSCELVVDNGGVNDRHACLPEVG